MNDQELMQNMGPEAESQNDWRLTLPETWSVNIRDENGRERTIPLREHPTLARYATKDEAVKALVHAQRLIGRRPGADPAQGFAAPDSPEAYELPDMDLPEGFELDEEIRAAFLARAFDLGLSAEQAAGLYQWFVPLNADTYQRLNEERESARERELEALRAVHRGETDALLEDAKRAAMTLGGEELALALEETGADRRAVVISALARMAPLFSEGRMRTPGAAPAPQLTEEHLVQMMRDPRYHDPTQRDPAFVRQIELGFERLFPGSYQPGNRI